MSPVRVPSTAAAGLGFFTAGLAAGLQLSGLPLGAVAVAGGIVAAGWGGSGRTAMLVALAGLLHGGLARRLDGGRCAAGFEAGPATVTLRVEHPGPPGRLVQAAVKGCHGSIRVRVPGRDTVWAGATGTVVGTWEPRPGRWGPADGVLIGTAVRWRPAVPAATDRLRNHLLRVTGRLYGPRAGMVEALMLGTRGTIDREVAAAFSQTGLVHLLSISGFHVGLVWGWLLLGFRLARMPRAAPIAAAVVIAGYVTFIGAPAPAVRAAALAILTSIERHRQRLPMTGALFAVVAGIVLLADPWALGDLGAWLSATALWGATAATRWSDRVLGDRAIWTMLAGSIGATIATAPITALAFGSIPLIGVALNLVAIPLTALAVPAVAASLALAGIPAAAASFAAGGGGLLAVLELIADRGAGIPGAALIFEPGPAPAALAALFVGIMVWAFGSRHPAREAAERLLAAALAGGAAHALIGAWPRSHTGSRLTLHFLDVGQGDAVLLETGRGRWLLVDAGPVDGSRDAGRRVIVPYLRRHGVRTLDAAVISHAHRDHFGGLGAVLGAVRVERIFDPARPAADREYAQLLERIARQDIAWYPLRAGARLAVDEVRIDVVHPDSGWARWGDDLNEDSAVLRITSGGFVALLTGDAGLPAEAVLAARVGAISLLKVGHHGSRGATGAEWLGRLRPKAAVISVGANNYGHPAPEALERLAAAGVAVWRTDQDGSVTVEVSDSTFRIAGRRGERRIRIE
ncbi:MAG: DNA internalization-related competence protein ComEC/Rec2 [Gemmatimonadales bacterium]|nr:DNA internalization-related competence protein ComEC/Rec2 [Gemmatimonadales bacterium]